MPSRTGQVYAEHNVNLLKTCLADVKAENKPAYIAVAPLRASAAAPSPSEKALALAGDSGGGGDSVNQRTHGDEAALQIIRMPSDTEEPEPGNKHVRAKRPTTKQISDCECSDGATSERGRRSGPRVLEYTDSACSPAARRAGVCGEWDV